MRLETNSKEVANGKGGAGNGGGGEDERFGNHSRTEVTRLIIQALHEMGYDKAAQELEEDSGLSIESHQVTRFRKAILSGDWNSAELLVDELQLEEQPQGGGGGGGGGGLDGDKKKKGVRFLIKRQKFLEKLETKQIREAVNVLRQEITPMNYDENQVHSLSRLLMCPSLESIREKTNGWDGRNGHSRYLLLEKLETFISPVMMIPYHRLATLLTQAQQQEISQCVYHTQDIHESSLYTDHKCDVGLFPSETVQVLREHSDEVWIVKFSHDGKRLATGSRDHTAIIWDVNTWEVEHVLRGHIASVPFLDWSYDDLYLITCGSEKVGKNMVKVWDTKTGECILTLDSHTDEISACLFLPGPSREFVSADVDGTIILWSFEGKEIYRWLSRRVYGLAISPNGKYMITITECKKLEKNINMYNLDTKQPIVEIEINRNVTSVVFSKDSKYGLFNVSHASKNNNNYNEESETSKRNTNSNLNLNGGISSSSVVEQGSLDNLEEVHLWDIEKVRLVRKYFGQRQGDFVIRSCFGGPQDNFIISGSEDSKVYIWNRSSGNLMNVLIGHSQTVNAVDWRGGRMPLIASASDDYTVRIWGGSSSR